MLGGIWLVLHVVLCVSELELELELGVHLWMVGAGLVLCSVAHSGEVGRWLG